VPQLWPVAPASGPELRLQHSSGGHRLMRADLSESGVDINQRLLSSQQRCRHTSAGNTVGEVQAAAAAWQHAQQCNSQVHQMPVSLTASLAYSKTSLTRTSGDRPKTSVLSEVRVI